MNEPTQLKLGGIGDVGAGLAVFFVVYWSFGFPVTPTVSTGFALVVSVCAGVAMFLFGWFITVLATALQRW